MSLLQGQWAVDKEVRLCLTSCSRAPIHQLTRYSDREITNPKSGCDSTKPLVGEPWLLHVLYVLHQYTLFQLLMLPLRFLRQLRMYDGTTADAPIFHTIVLWTAGGGSRTVGASPITDILVPYFQYSDSIIWQPAARQKHRACNRPPGDKACSRIGGLTTNPPCDKLIADYSTVHRGSRQGFITEGPRQRYVTEVVGDRGKPLFRGTAIYLKRTSRVLTTSVFDVVVVGDREDKMGSWQQPQQHWKRLSPSVFVSDSVVLLVSSHGRSHTCRCLPDTCKFLEAPQWSLQLLALLSCHALLPSSGSLKFRVRLHAEVSACFLMPARLDPYGPCLDVSYTWCFEALPPCYVRSTERSGVLGLLEKV